MSEDDRVSSSLGQPAKLISGKVNNGAEKGLCHT